MEHCHDSWDLPTDGGKVQGMDLIKDRHDREPLWFVFIHALPVLLTLMITFLLAAISRKWGENTQNTLENVTRAFRIFFC